MKSNYFKILAIMLSCIIGLASCADDDLYMSPEQGDAPEGFVKLSFETDIQEMEVVKVRGVDPDGYDVHNMTLFCFNPYGLFVTTVEATLTKTTATTGTFEAVVPEETKIVHFVANQNSALYDNKDFINKSEASVIADMEGASGMMVYWARFEASDNGTKLKEELADLPNGIVLVRNQAKVSIADWNTPYIEVTGFVTTNIHAFGTVAPYSNEEGFEWPGIHPYITLPNNTVMMSDIEDVNTKEEDYIFEHENTVDNPVSVIIRGVPQGETQEKYFRVAIVDADGEQLMIKRNHSYVLNISGKLTHGSDTFQEAMEAPFTNNVWISIDSWVKAVEDATYKLEVKETGIVLDANEAGSDYKVYYTITRKNGSLTSADMASVVWLGENDVAQHNFVNHEFAINGNVGEGCVTIKLNPMAKDIQTGTLLIKKGRLQRTVEVNVIKTQVFTPAWVGTQVYGGATGQFVTVKFTVPEECPDVLYPFPVLVTVNSLDVRSASGMQLPVIRKGDDEWFGADYANHDYKYEYIVESPGVHRIYFENILTHEDGDKESVWLEANHFETLEKEFEFSGYQKAITVSGLNKYYGGTVGDTYADDEVVYYKLVPKKRYAHVDFNMVMMDNSTDPATPINVGVNDEFLLFSKSLDHYEDHEPIPGGLSHECNYYEVDESYWKTSSNGRMVMFMPKNPTPANTGHYALHLKTNRPISDDVVRIASNASMNPSILPSNSGANYTGNSYRSMIFELATYRPFRFAARVNGLGENTTGQNEETVSNIELTYLPNQNVDISFDVTSFEGSDGACVDPFGESFEIYIDAPMLTIDESRLGAFNLTGAKLFAHPSVKGRFVYKVEPTRDAERNFGTGEALLKDNSASSQAGERKTLPFKTNRVTTAGDLKISSNKEKVIFYDKVFRLRNKKITGTIQYNDGGSLRDVPEDAFVAFARTKDGVRIGSIEIAEGGKYSLNLRSEYEFNWTMDEIEFDFNIGGVDYDCKIGSLDELFNSPNVVLNVAI